MKLWYFRTPEGTYGLHLSDPRMSQIMYLIDAGHFPLVQVLVFNSKPADMPKLAPGEYRPVEVEGR